MSRRHRSAHPCPTATKTGYPDEAAADAAMHRLREEYAHVDTKLPCRSYKCKCGRWHLTSQLLAYG